VGDDRAGQQGAPAAESRAILTNNARAESIASRPTYRDAWRRGQRCLIPCAWYQEPNWETGRNIWWRMRRADGAPWALGGTLVGWTDPASGEIVPSFTMITINCDGHPLLGRLHKPDPQLPDDAQDKRSVVPLEPADWDRLAGRRRGHGARAAAGAAGRALRPGRCRAHRCLARRRPGPVPHALSGARGWWRCRWWRF
jgi:hypothetical protein